MKSLDHWANAAAQELRLRQSLQEGITRTHRELAGSHTVVTYPPLDYLRPVDPEKVLDALPSQPEGWHLYAHIAFCEYRCGFCHYHTTTPHGGAADDRVGRYLDALRTEVRGWCDRLGGTVATVYVGGGTPTLLTPQQIDHFVSSFSTVSRSEGFEASFEASPLTLAENGATKLEAFRAGGFSRVSLGVQSFSDHLSEEFRGHPAGVSGAAVELIQSAQMSLNIDLIQDLPGQTVADLEEDLTAIDALRPDQVTWYSARFRPESRLYRQLAKGELKLPAPFESARRRLIIREGMRRLGYTPAPGGRFTLSGSPDRYKESRISNAHLLIGAGASAYSHSTSHLFRNHTARSRLKADEEYIRRVSVQGHAIDTGATLDAEEQLVSALINRLRAGKLTRSTAELLCERSLWMARLISRLKSARLLHTSDEHVSFTELGWLFEEEIYALFYSQKVRELIQRSRSALDTTHVLKRLKVL